MAQQLDDEAKFRILLQLVESVPNFSKRLGDEQLRWLGRAGALIEATGDSSKSKFDSEIGRLSNQYMFEDAVQNIKIMLHRALARAELRAPAGVRGAFIPVGHSFDVFSAVSKIMSQAKNDLFLVDPYMDATAVQDFVPLAPEGILVRLLSDDGLVKPSFQPAVTRWVKQYAAARPIEARLAVPRALHDRLLIVDGSEAWVLTQSLKDFAARSPGSITRSETEAGALKIDYYREIWHRAKLCS